MRIRFIALVLFADLVRSLLKLPLFPPTSENRKQPEDHECVQGTRRRYAAEFRSARKILTFSRTSASSLSHSRIAD